MTYPASALSVDAAVVSGAFSQYGWIPQVRRLEIICVPLMNMRFLRRASVYGYPGPGKEWHAAVYADGTYLMSFYCLIVTQNCPGGTYATYAVKHYNE